MTRPISTTPSPRRLSRLKRFPVPELFHTSTLRISRSTDWDLAMKEISLTFNLQLRSTRNSLIRAARRFRSPGTTMFGSSSTVSWRSTWAVFTAPSPELSHWTPPPRPWELPQAAHTISISSRPSGTRTARASALRRQSFWSIHPLPYRNRARCCSSVLVSAASGLCGAERLLKRPRARKILPPGAWILPLLHRL